jgi:hypothetical protein
VQRLVPRQCGVGVYLKQAEEGFVEVRATEPGCSADGSLFVGVGLCRLCCVEWARRLTRFAGDIVNSIDGTACVGLSVRDITRLIVGRA